MCVSVQSCIKKASHAAIKKGITLNQMIKQALEKELENH